ncbi:MAG: hypothetical protein ACI9XZ_000739 [Alphaproteobacteria bacterium]|jgi:hypothetical protein
MPTLTFNCVTNNSASKTVTFESSNLVLAGWTGRDRAAVEHHIEELKELGVAPPSSTPVYYRTGVELCIQSEHLQVLGPDTSGEVEYVLLSMDDGLWFTVGSDQTDRKAEAIGIALSKQLAAKPMAKTAWRVADFAEIWDALMIRSWATINGEKVLYQEAPFGSILSPAELIRNYNGSDTLPVGTVMMSGTPAAIGGIRPAERFDIEIADKLGTRRINHGYDIEVLPVIS